MQRHASGPCRGRTDAERRARLRALYGFTCDPQGWGCNTPRIGAPRFRDGYLGSPGWAATDRGAEPQRNATDAETATPSKVPQRKQSNALEACGGRTSAKGKRTTCSPARLGCDPAAITFPFFFASLSLYNNDAEPKRTATDSETTTRRGIRATRLKTPTTFCYRRTPRKSAI